MTKYPYKTCIGFNAENLATIERICSDIRNMDPTFRFKIERMVEKFREKHDSILIIRSKTLDQAHKRGTIFVKKYLSDLGDHAYWVKGEDSGEREAEDVKVS